MKLTFRWYGGNDPVTLEKIKQIPVIEGIVSAVYDVPPGQVWTDSSIQDIKTKALNNNLEFEVVESVPVHEDIKLAAKGSNIYIDNYIENIKRLSKAGVKVICYNFMPVFDWFRSNLKNVLPDGSNALSYRNEEVEKLDPSQGVSLPGWDESYKKEELRALLHRYESIDEKALWHNLQTFLEAIIPVCEKTGMKMAIHPDDPPWGIFGLPRIITNKKNLQKFLSLVPSQNNGLTFCTGSYGADEKNKLPEMIKASENRIHFAHIRNVKYTGYRSFEESAHPTKCGSLNIYEIVKALYQSGFDGYIRPDHGRFIWGEEGRHGYGLYDRALGAMYIAGLWEAIEGEVKK